MPRGSTSTICPLSLALHSDVDISVDSALLWEIGSYTIAGPPEPEGRHDSSGGEEEDEVAAVDAENAAYAQERLLLEGVRKGKFTVTLHGASSSSVMS